MQVRVAKTAGFCFGVERAVKLVEEALANEEGTVCTLGPIIHNERVAADLRARGVVEVDENSLLSDGGAALPQDAVIVIRSHGTSRKVKEMLDATGCKIVDATCPFVSKIHETVTEMHRDGRHVVIIGSATHPEVKGTSGWVDGPYTVIETEADFQKLPSPEEARLGVVAQTTFRQDKFDVFIENIKHMGYDVLCANTICSATSQRQIEAMELAAQSDVMLVIGGKQSSNTQKLYDICQSRCKDTYFIQGLTDLKHVTFLDDQRVGITAGASTPNYIIEEVSSYVRGTEL